MFVSIISHISQRIIPHSFRNQRRIAQSSRSKRAENIVEGCPTTHVEMRDSIFGSQRILATLHLGQIVQDDLVELGLKCLQNSDVSPE